VPRTINAEMAAGDDDAAGENRTPLPDQAIGDPAARQARHVDHRRVEAVHGARDRRLEPEPARGDRRGHEQDQQRAHAVVTEPLPHLGEEQHRKAARMAEECTVVGARLRDSRHGTKNTMIVSACAVRS